MKNDEILINNLYNSNPKAFANEGKNIVHEIINLFKANDGKHYIYIVKDGTIDEEHNDRISNILLTRCVKNKMTEIVAWVKEPIQLVRKKKGKNSKKELSRQLEAYIGNINYDIKNCVNIKDIFAKNTFKGETEKNGIYATFVANEVVKPKVPIFLTYDEIISKTYPNTYLIKQKKVVNQSQRTYIEHYNTENNEENEDYITIDELFKKDIWEEDAFPKIDIDEFIQLKKEDNFNFLKLIGLENYEPAFSNFFQYIFLKNKKIFKEFSKEILNVDINVQDEEFEIKREEYNIDILIRDSKNLIVIENKIKSGINGKKYDDYGNLVQTQLEKYIKYANCETDKFKDKDRNKTNPAHPHFKDKSRTPHFFIFAPNYKHLKSDKFIKEAKKYKIITYKEIYDFYKDKGKYFKDNYFEDFLKALKKHTKEVDSEIYDIMLDRLAKRIIEIKDNKNG